MLPGLPPRLSVVPAYPILWATQVPSGISSNCLFGHCCFFSRATPAEPRVAQYLPRREVPWQREFVQLASSLVAAEDSWNPCCGSTYKGDNSAQNSERSLSGQKKNKAAAAHAGLPEAAEVWPLWPCSLPKSNWMQNEDLGEWINIWGMQEWNESTLPCNLFKGHSLAARTVCRSVRCPVGCPGCLSMHLEVLCLAEILGLLRMFGIQISLQMTYIKVKL